MAHIRDPLWVVETQVLETLLYARAEAGHRQPYASSFLARRRAASARIISFTRSAVDALYRVGCPV